jgi:hypothetical protein
MKPPFDPMRARWRLHAAALVGYLSVALAFAWPLPAHLATHLPGDPAGDTGVYVWNLWVFRHELTVHGRLPLLTTSIFSLTAPADLSLHNYTIFADLLALPLLPALGTIATFNVLYLAMTVLTAYCTFLLARAVVRHGLAAWMAGVLFAWSPSLVARGTAHFSLVAAAPLPIFLLCLLYLGRTASLRAAAGAGLTVAWAALCDPYYAVYCLLIGAVWFGATVVRISARERDLARRRAALARLLDAGMVAVATVAAVIVLTGGTELAFGKFTLSAHTLYTPMLLLTVLVLARLAMARRVQLTALATLSGGELRRLAPLVLVGLLCATLPLSPVLYALGRRAAEGRWIETPVRWRTSTRGVDVVALVLPNPNHPLLGPRAARWIAGRAGPLGMPEEVGSLPFVALGLVGWACWRRHWRPPRPWAALTIVFLLIALGPFVTVGGVNTAIPTPWTVLRYLPPIGYARAPARALVVALLGVAILAASALARVLEANPRRARVLAGSVLLAVLAELWPAPRPLFGASVPAFYHRIAADPREVRVLELPTGVRDGTFSVGDFSALAQFYQTVHHKPLVGGYLSRVSRRRVRQFRELPVLDALVTLSEARPLTAEQRAAAFAARDTFLARARLGYVVIDRARATPDLIGFATELFALRRIDGDGRRELYRPAPP